jgi:hypothetical protein
VAFHATRFRNGRTVSCIPIARRTALKLLSSGFPLGRQRAVQGIGIQIRLSGKFLYAAKSLGHSA